MNGIQKLTERLARQEPAAIVKTARVSRASDASRAAASSALIAFCVLIVGSFGLSVGAPRGVPARGRAYPAGAMVAAPRAEAVRYAGTASRSGWRCDQKAARTSSVVASANNSPRKSFAPGQPVE